MSVVEILVRTEDHTPTHLEDTAAAALPDGLGNIAMEAKIYSNGLPYLQLN